MYYTLGQAAKATGKGKTTIANAIEKGRLSAQKDDLGQYQIDAAELHRVYPVQVDRTQKPNAVRLGQDTNLLIENATLKAKLDVLEQFNRQLEGRLDKADQQNARLTALLEAPKEDPYAAILERLEAIEVQTKAETHPAPVEAPKGFWRRLVG
jgi:hypothetical protein